MGEWQCRTCTFINDDSSGAECVMCQAARPSPHRRKSTGESAPALTSNAPGKLGSSFPSRQCHETTDDGDATSMGEDRVAKSSRCTGTMGNAAQKKNGTLGAFTSTGRSSVYDEGGGSNDRGSDERNGRAGSNAGWDAFQMLEQNYQSSEEDEVSSTDDEDDYEDRGDEGEGDFKEGTAGTEDENDVGLDESKRPSLNKQKSEMEYVDLFASDEESEIDTAAAAPGKENNKIQKESSKARRPRKEEPYVIDVDSDSSLSEVESRRPLPPHSSRKPPPWQRRRSGSTPIQIDDNSTMPESFSCTSTRNGRRSSATPIHFNDNLKRPDSFSCMSTRNDIIGGSGAGVNAFLLARKKDVDAKGKPAKKRAAKKKQAKASASGRTSRKSSASASKSKKKKPKAAKAKATASKTKKRRRSSYRRSSKHTKAGRTSDDNVWSARERGIRQPRRRSGSSAPYMAVAKQEPMLRNIGGASIQF